MTVPVSVVIPLYNKAAEIERTLASVFAQRCSAAEVIVVDDGSTDGSAEQVLAAGGDQIRLIRQQNMGVSAARNAGIAAASHEYVCLLDADDEWLPEYLCEMLRLIETYPEAVFYSVRRFFADERGRHVRAALGLPDDYFGVIQDPADIFARGYGLLCSSSVCIRRSIFEGGLAFPVGEPRGEDMYYWLQLSLRGSLAFSARSLARIHLDASNRSGARPKRDLPYHIAWYMDERDLILQQARGSSVERFVLANALVQVYGFVLQGNRVSAWDVVQSLGRLHPLFALRALPAFLVPRWVLGAVRWLRRKRR